jgi:hypothetical protein
MAINEPYKQAELEVCAYDGDFCGFGAICFSIT